LERIKGATAPPYEGGRHSLIDYAETNR
jgi:hypothetical protein